MIKRSSVTAVNWVRAWTGAFMFLGAFEYTYSETVMKPKNLRYCQNQVLWRMNPNADCVWNLAAVGCRTIQRHGIAWAARVDELPNSGSISHRGTHEEERCGDACNRAKVYMML